MVDPRLQVVVGLFAGAWTGLAVGLALGNWSTTLLALTGLIALQAAAGEWLKPDVPRVVPGERWDALEGRTRRAIARSIARGERVPPGTSAWTAAGLAELVANEPPTWRDIAGAACWIGIGVVVVGAAGLGGAPPAWVATGAAGVPVIAVSHLLPLTDGARDRARRAAEANRALTPPRA